MIPRACVRALISLALFATGLAAVLGPTWPLAATTLDATGATFQFGVTGQTVSNQADLGNVGLPAGSSITYAAVATVSGTVIDARVTFVQGSNLADDSNPPNPGRLRRLDTSLGSSATSPYLDHYLKADVYPGPRTMADIRVEFFLTGTTTPVVLSNVAANFYDIDGRESIELSDVSSYTLSGNTILTTTPLGAGSVRIAETNGVETATTSSIRTAYTMGRAKVVFEPTSSISYRLFVGDNASGAKFEVDFSPGEAWVDSGGAQTEVVTSQSASTSAPVVLPPELAPLVTAPVVAPTPSTTVPSTTLPPTTPSTTTPTTTAPPAPLPAPEGGLPELGSTEVLVTEDGDPVAVELVVENDEALVLRSQDFELRLRGNCTTGCTITDDATGRETIHLDRNGAARVSGFGFLPGSLVHVWIFSEPRYLGALLVAEDGTYDGTFPLDDIEVGGHTLQANGFSFDNVPRSANLGIIVVDAAAPAPTPAPTALPATGNDASTVGLGLGLLLAGSFLTMTGRRRRHTH